MRAVAYVDVGQPNRAWRLRSSSVSAYRSVVPQSPVHTPKTERFMSLRRSSPTGGRLWFCGAIAVALGDVRVHRKRGGSAAHKAPSKFFTGPGGRADSTSSI